MKNADSPRYDPIELEREWERVRSWGIDEDLDAPPVSESDRARKEEVKENRRASAELVTELRAIGIPLDNIGQLGNVRARYPLAVPILLRHLDRPYPPGVTGSILQALARPYSRVVFDEVLRCLKSRLGALSRDEEFCYGLPLSANASKDDLDRLVSIIVDPTYGRARSTLALRIARWKDPRVPPAIECLFRESGWEWISMRAARLAKMWYMRKEVEPYLTCSILDWRQEARLFMRALEKAERLPGR